MASGNFVFDTWWQTAGQPWATKCVERGGTVWTDDMNERRELFDRRHTRPAPPEGMSAPVSLAAINHRDDDVRAATDDSLGGCRAYRVGPGFMAGAAKRRRMAAIGILIEDEENAA